VKDRRCICNVFHRQNRTKNSNNIGFNSNLLPGKRGHPFSWRYFNTSNILNVPSLMHIHNIFHSKDILFHVDISNILNVHSLMHIHNILFQKLENNVKKIYISDLFVVMSILTSYFIPMTSIFIINPFNEPINKLIFYHKHFIFRNTLS